MIWTEEQYPFVSREAQETCVSDPAAEGVVHGNGSVQLDPSSSEPLKKSLRVSKGQR